MDKKRGVKYLQIWPKIMTLALPLTCVLFYMSCPFFQQAGAFYKKVTPFHEIWLLLSEMLWIKDLHSATFVLHTEGLKIKFIRFSHRNAQLMTHSWPQYLVKKEAL